MSLLALRCDVDGVVRAVLRDEVGGAWDGVGRPLAALLDPSSLTRGLRLFDGARRDGVTAPLEILVRSAARPLVLLASVARDEAGLLLVAAPDRRSLEELCLALPDEPGAREIARALSGSGPSQPDGERAVGELMRLHNELANLERELARQNGQLERAAADKDLILGTAAHDLRSPLQSIAISVAFLELQLGKHLGQTERDVLARIRKSSELMKRLVDDLLDVASLDHGGPRLQRGALDLTPVLHEVRDVHAALAAEQGVLVRLSIEGDLPAVDADADRVRQVLANLLSNAVGHTPVGRAVTVTARNRARDVEISVLDQGPGIAPESLPALFEPFARGVGIRRHGGSIGLGLAISRALVEAHGGTIDARNVPDGGAWFRFTLPRHGRPMGEGLTS